MLVTPTRSTQEVVSPMPNQATVRATIAERFFTKIEYGECWEWVASRSPEGYGRFNDGSPSPAYAHRWAYEFLVGPIPKGLELDHLCRVRHCVRPEHLEPVTHRENDVRGMAPTMVTRRSGVCKRGHVYTPAPNGSGRTCKVCRDERNRRRFQ